MNKNTRKKKALENLADLKNNSHAGDLMVLGLNSAATHMVQIYAIVEQDEDRCNRKLARNEGHVWVEDAITSDRVGNENFFYSVMMEVNGIFLVGNGRQTKTLEKGCREKKADISAIFHEVLAREEYKDEDFGPRITGYCCRAQDPTVELSIIRKADHDTSVDQDFYRRTSVPPGFGYFISAHRRNGRSASPFTGKPKIMPIEGSYGMISRRYWEALHPNRVALAVKWIPLKSRGKSITYILDE